MQKLNELGAENWQPAFVIGNTIILYRAVGDEKIEVVDITPDMSEGEDEYWVEWFCCPNCDDDYITRRFNYCPNCGVGLRHVETVAPDVVEKSSSI